MLSNCTEVEASTMVYSQLIPKSTCLLGKLTLALSLNIIIIFTLILILTLTPMSWVRDELTATLNHVCVKSLFFTSSLSCNTVLAHCGCIFMPLLPVLLLEALCLQLVSVILRHNVTAGDKKFATQFVACGQSSAVAFALFVGANCSYDWLIVG